MSSADGISRADQGWAWQRFKAYVVRFTKVLEYVGLGKMNGERKDERQTKRLALITNDPSFLE